MRVLIVGGSGYVGGLVLPILAQHCSLRVFDLLPPQDGSWEYVRGDVTNPETLDLAVKGTDALIYMAVGLKDEDGSFNSRAATQAAFDVSVKGLYLALDAARKAGNLHAVYTSTMSIYQGPLEHRYFRDENLMPDARDSYGLTKSLGEEVCRYAVRAWGMSVNALRLCLPISLAHWHTSPYDCSPLYTAGDDCAQALLAALKYRHGFEAFTISGDYNHSYMNLSKAKRLLRWAPTARAAGVAGPNKNLAMLKRFKRMCRTRLDPRKFLFKYR
jgi:NAD dependent epimerase/dehydratase family